MNCPHPANLAVLACPGGETFAGEVAACLQKEHLKKFSRIIDQLAGQYGLERDAAMEKVNFIYDCLSGMPEFSGDPVSRHNPRFKIPANFTLFPNGEIKAEILKSVRGKDLYIVQDVENHCPLDFNGGKISRVMTVNDHLLTLIVTIDAAQQAGAGRITLVLPTYPYARQHKKKGREGLTASQAGRIFETLGVERIITLDIHSQEIGHAFNRLHLENLHASYQIIRVLSEIEDVNGDIVMVAPDTGAVDRNRFYANALKKPLAVLYKERDYSRVTEDALHNNISEIRLLGDVKDKIVFMADDMLGTGGTLLKAMKFLSERGARRVICAVSLPLFSGDAVKYFDEAYEKGYFYRIIGTNAVTNLLDREWYCCANISKLFAKTIARLHRGASLSSLLDNREVITRLFSQDKNG